MNPAILKLFGVVLVLFAALVGLTSYNSVLNAPAYRDNPRNARTVIEQARIPRGVIRADDGGVLARSVQQPGDAGLFSRIYTPLDRLFAHAVGYSFVDIRQAGLERSRNDELSGANNGLGSIVDELRGKHQEGDDVTTNLDPAAQRVALAGLAGRKGAVVAMEPATGKIRVMASTPGYDPAGLDKGNKFKDLNLDNADAPLLNRVTQAGYPPGSTMKVVTATAAIDTGKFTPDSLVNGDSPKIISGVPLANDDHQSYGNITLTKALTDSVNTVWAQVAEQLGRATMDRYMRRFGFYSDPPLDYPDSQMIPSGVYDSRQHLVKVTDDSVDIGRVGIGQERLRVTPLQMLTVAATVANDGVRVEPQLTDRVVDPDGRVVEKLSPKPIERVMKPSTATALNEMMGHVVSEGTATAAALKGIEVAGKTGTAELNLKGLNQPWFIGFAPRSAPKVAVAVTIEHVQGGFGGVVAAPIARDVMQELLR